MDRLFFLELKHACAHVTKEASAEAQREIGVFGAQAQALITLSSIDRGRISDLANQLQLGKSGISTLVNRLVKQGLVSTGADPQDARSTLLELTPKGRQASTKVLEMIGKIDAQLTDGITSQELEAVIKFLRNATALKLGTQEAKS